MLLLTYTKLSLDATVLDATARTVSVPTSQQRRSLQAELDKAKLGAGMGLAGHKQ